MKRLTIALRILSLSLVAFSFLMTPSAQAGQKQRSQFLGIWEGVDEQDGSLIEALISKGGKNEFKFLWYETYWRTCDGGRAIFKGTGSLKPNAGVLSFLMLMSFALKREAQSGKAP